MSDESPSISPFEGDYPIFEQECRENGKTTWTTDTLAELLGYKTTRALMDGPIKKARILLSTLNIDPGEHIIKGEYTDEDGRVWTEIRLTRFACYLVTMQSDPRKKEVARAITYFASFAEYCRQYMGDVEGIDRVLIRDEISEHEKTLTTAAKRSQVTNFKLFQSAGYRGLYDMSLTQLRKLKRVPSRRSPLDFMGKTELAANLFRITQTEEAIRNNNVVGQKDAEKTAEQVGKVVRKTMHEISGTRPEKLKPSQDIKKVRASLKKTGQDLLDVDKPKKSPRKKAAKKKSAKGKG